MLGLETQFQGTHGYGIVGVACDMQGYKDESTK